MDLKALKIHVTSSSVYSCFINVIEPRMAPVENKDIICPPKNEVIEYNKANMKFVCGHCYVTGSGGTSRSIGVMGLYTNRCGSNRLKPSCIKKGFQGKNVNANLILNRRKKYLKGKRGEIKESIAISLADFQEFEEFKRLKVAPVENSTTTTSKGEI